VSTPNWSSFGCKPSKKFTKEVGFTPLGCARVTIRLQESIPKWRRTETQTFVFLDLFFNFNEMGERRWQLFEPRLI
jgi:hypothetical protein